MHLPILLDQDGVLADFVDGLFFELKQFTPHELYKLLPNPRTLPKFYVEECVETGDERHDKLLKDLINEVTSDRVGLFDRLPPMAGATFFAPMLKEKTKALGIGVRVCTSPMVENATCHSDKAKWLARVLGPSWAKEAIMTSDKTLVQGLVLVDDKPIIKGTVERPTWEHVIFDASYNQGIAGSRVYGWNEQAVDFIIDRAVKSQHARLRGD